jgi:hypothetical protein
MILGYVILGPDNGYNMYRNLQLDKCSKYMNVYSIDKIDKDMRIRKLKNDFTYTYDGFAIVSDRFKQFCERESYHGIEFIDVSGCQKYFWFKIQNVIEFDAEARRTQFISFNAECNGYEEIIGATPACLKQTTPLPDGFFRTDIFFGSYAGKSPLELIGAATKEKMEAEDFSGIYFKEILTEYDWQK